MGWFSKLDEKKEWPKCPHCQKEISRMLWREQQISTTRILMVYFCPNSKCRKVLGIQMDSGLMPEK